MNGALSPPAPVLGSPTDRLLEVDGITKSFAGVRVLNRVSLRVGAGEAHALVGENGAGKSTLMKVLAGIYAPDSGQVRLQGRRLEPGNPHAALRAGIAMIYQELLPFLDLSIAENIFMGQEPVSRLWRWIDKPAMDHQARALLARLGLNLPTHLKMRHLRVAQMQLVEIAKALAHRARIIIMDEPTSALSDRETESLFRIIADLRQNGATIIYISHKLDEVFRLAKRITVLRDGVLVGTYPVEALSRERLITLMVGAARSLQAAATAVFARRGGDVKPAELPVTQGLAAERGELKERVPTAASPAVALSVRGLCKADRFRKVTFEVRRGEILGLAGLMGAGRTDVLHALYGLEPADAGEICVGGRLVRIRNSREALQAGIALVTEDRKLFGIVPTMGVQPNITLSALRRWCWHGFIEPAAEARVAEEQILSFAIRASGRHQLLDRLSGGNQQKVVLARALLSEPQILLLDEPTRGIDIAAKAEVHTVINQLARSGKAVVLVSSELPELMALSDRILVMRQGEIAAELSTRATTPEEILGFAIPQ